MPFQFQIAHLRRHAAVARIRPAPLAHGDVMHLGETWFAEIAKEKISAQKDRVDIEAGWAQISTDTKDLDDIPYYQPQDR